MRTVTIRVGAIVLIACIFWTILLLASPNSIPPSTDETLVLIAIAAIVVTGGEVIFKRFLQKRG